MASNGNMMLTNYVVIGKKTKQHYKVPTIINNYKQPFGYNIWCKVATCDNGN
jgi:hypothetical protein